MKHLYELPTDDVIVSCLANDVIGRNQDVVNFCSIIDSFKYSTIVSLDGSWGSGKTFFIKQAKMLLDGTCNPKTLNDETLGGFKKAIDANLNIYSELSFKQKHSTVYYDAWANDDHTDPVLSIIYSVIKTEQVKLHVGKDRDFLHIVSSIAECVTGRSIDAFFEAIKGEDFFEDLKKHESINELMQKFFDAAIGEECDRLVIFIDELDRCKPSFAVLLLERIKHFFNDDRLTFVFSLNRDQLQHTIRAFYGNEMNASKYLDKFFDLNIRIPEANRSKYLHKIGFAKTTYIYDAVCYATIDTLNLELREITKYVQHLKITTYGEAHELLPSRGDSYFIQFCMIFIVPILIGLQLVDQNRFSQFIFGVDDTVLIDILDTEEFAYASEVWLLADNEVFGSPVYLGKAEEVNYKERLHDVYKGIFQKKYISGRGATIGKMTLNANSRKDLLRLIDPISSYNKDREF